MKDSTRTGHDAPAHEPHRDPSPPLKHQDQTKTRRSARHIDERREDTSPASDPPATGRITRIEPDTPPGTHDDGPWQAPAKRRDE
ncbi:hypothetical protein [Burkholderia sp. BCC1977]|uniref:hypothetical protein n=1 Tax=Burkholderia sp. BCC1977 TaxID=2817440 RepID=UPI002ABDBC18|nr:hypothetical protein [Burkholderia sp. BCC1977]